MQRAIDWARVLQACADVQCTTVSELFPDTELSEAVGTACTPEELAAALMKEDWEQIWASPLYIPCDITEEPDMAGLARAALTSILTQWYPQTDPRSPDLQVEVGPCEWFREVRIYDRVLFGRYPYRVWIGSAFRDGEDPETWGQFRDQLQQLAMHLDFQIQAWCECRPAAASLDR